SHSFGVHAPGLGKVLPHLDLSERRRLPRSLPSCPSSHASNTLVEWDRVSLPEDATGFLVGGKRMEDLVPRLEVLDFGSHVEGGGNQLSELEYGRWLVGTDIENLVGGFGHVDT